MEAAGEAEEQGEAQNSSSTVWKGEAQTVVEAVDKSVGQSVVGARLLS